MCLVLNFFCFPFTASARVELLILRGTRKIWSLSGKRKNKKLHRKDLKCCDSSWRDTKQQNTFFWPVFYLWELPSIAVSIQSGIHVFIHDTLKWMFPATVMTFVKDKQTERLQTDILFRIVNSVQQHLCSRHENIVA